MESSSPFEDGRIRRISLEEWVGLPKDEEGEWVDGWLVEEEVSSFLHELVAAWFVAALRAWAVPRGGFVIGSDFKFVVSKRRGRKPDLSVFLPQRRPTLEAPAADFPPEIALEIISPRARDVRRDRIDKLSEYAQFGVRLYWLIDPRARTMEIFELNDGRYVLATSASNGRMTLPGCEGLVIDLDALWAEVERAGTSTGST